MYDFRLTDEDIVGIRETVRDLAVLDDRRRRAAMDRRFSEMRKTMPPAVPARPARPAWPAGAGLAPLLRQAALRTKDAMPGVHALANAFDQRRQADAKTQARAKLAAATQKLAAMARAGQVSGRAAAAYESRLARVEWALR